jgi:hypothetical protein
MPGVASAPGIRTVSDYAVRRILRTPNPRARPASPARPINGIGLAVLGIDVLDGSVVLVEGVELSELGGVSV